MGGIVVDTMPTLRLNSGATQASSEFVPAP
jgi:hypothetical protein